MRSQDIEKAAVAPGLTGQEQTALAHMVKQWRSHQPSNDLRSLYYLGKRSLRAAGKLGMSMPPSLGKLETVLGWSAKAVTTLEHRLNPAGFVVPGQAEPDPVIQEIEADNQLTELQSMTHTAALIQGSAYVTVSAGNPDMDEPEALISARSAREATAIISKRTRRVVCGLTINPTGIGTNDQLVLWLPNQVVEITRSGNVWSVVRKPHWLGRVPMEVLTFRPHLDQVFGMPRITDEVMDLQDSAVRTMLRMEGTAEFFSFPQRYALGADGDDFEDTFKTYLNRFLALGRDDSGDLPTVGQFNASSPQPHIEQLRATAGLFSGATSIPLNYLGIVHDNPSSADAIHAAESDLINVAERGGSGFSPPWSRTMTMAHQVKTGMRAPDPRLRRLMMEMRDPATPTKTATSQSVMALVSQGVLPPNSPITYRLLGYSEPQIEQLVSDSRSMAGRRALAALTPPVDDPEVDGLTATNVG